MSRECASMVIMHMTRWRSPLPSLPCVRMMSSFSWWMMRSSWAFIASGSSSSRPKALFTSCT